MIPDGVTVTLVYHDPETIRNDPLPLFYSSGAIIAYSVCMTVGIEDYITIAHIPELLSSNFNHLKIAHV